MKRKRIITYYALAIFLPCLVLGVLAFRGIKNDQALVERDQLNNLREISVDIIRETDTHISTIEKEFDSLAEALEIPRESIFRDSLLSQFCRTNKSVAGIYFLPDAVAPRLLNNGLLYVPDGSSDPSEAEKYIETEILLQQGWRHEFRDKNYPEALRSYRNILTVREKQGLAGPVYMAIARVQNKLNLHGEAEKTYRLVWEDFPDENAPGNIPLGAAALMEMSLLQLTGGDTLAALSSTYLLVRNLMEFRWNMEHAVYSDFISRVDRILMDVEKSANPEVIDQAQQIEAVKESITGLEQKTGYLLSFLGNPDVSSLLHEKTRDNVPHRHRIQINTESYLVHYFFGNGHTGWGLILDQDYILQQLILTGLQAHGKGMDFHWEVADLNDNILLRSEFVPDEIPPVHTVFPPFLPSWSMRLYPEDRGLFTSLFRAGEGLFLYIFLAILAVLLCGLFFTLKIVNNELNLSRMKSHFISTVSHEFKSPLTSIRQMAEMLAHERISTPEKQKQYFETILQQSERLSHLIENILDFSRIEEGHKTFRFEKGDVVPLVKEMVESFQILTADREFRITLEVPEPLPQIVFDREGISQVMHNLLDNAVKYSGDSRSIEVTLVRRGDRIVIGIRDHGYGIQKEEQEKIFSRFYRAGEELTQNVKGSGIGLTIVRQIVEAHHGEVTVDSSPGKGSLFSVELPINQSYT
jgi:signal transduction histidine kinase/tetratricopeptide (TPR) repeat protein